MRRCTRSIYITTRAQGAWRPRRGCSKANANFVGKSSVSVAGNSSNTSLELSPWTPSYVNNGHECLIAAVVEGDASPPTILDGNNDPTVAQHNLGVVNLGGQMEVTSPIRFRFAIHHALSSASRSMRKKRRSNSQRRFSRHCGRELTRLPNVRKNVSSSWASSTRFAHPRTASTMLSLYLKT